MVSNDVKTQSLRRKDRRVFKITLVFWVILIVTCPVFFSFYR